MKRIRKGKYILLRAKGIKPFRVYARDKKEELGIRKSFKAGLKKRKR